MLDNAVSSEDKEGGRFVESGMWVAGGGGVKVGVEEKDGRVRELVGWGYGG